MLLFIFNKKGLTLCLFCLLNTALSSYTNKTFLRPLDSSAYLPPENSFIDLLLVQKRPKSRPLVLLEERKKAKKTVHSCINLSYFHFQSNNSERMGRYFGVNEKNEFVLKGKNDHGSDDDLDVFANFLIHEDNFIQEDVITKIILNPKINYTGINLSFLHNFSKITKKLYFKFKIPVVKTETNLRLNHSTSNYPADLDPEIIIEYLKGIYQNNEVVDTILQEPLNYAKIDGKKTKTRISDFDLTLGYQAYNKKTKATLLFLGLTIPNSNKANGEYLFEPIAGNGGYYAINLGCDAYWNLYSKKKDCVDLLFNLKYAYLFKNTQKRTLSIKGANWGQYYLLGKKGNQNKPLIPAANILTRNVKVSPGNQLEGDIKLSWNHSDFNFNLGYHILFREKEKVKIKDPFPAATYAVAYKTFATNNIFGGDINNIQFDFNDYWLSQKNIDVDSAQSPSLNSHKIYGGITYNYTKKPFRHLATFNFGGSYNFTTQNSNFDGWGVWFKTMFYF